MTSARQGEVREHIDAPPDQVWDLLADVTRMGEWSPECHRVRWLGGASSPAEPGARFKGSNKSGLLRWSMTCEVKAAERGREIAWSTIWRGREVVRWTYLLEPTNTETGAATGTDVVESFEALSWPLYVKFFEDIVMRDRDARRDAAMRTTLARIKAVAERQAAGSAA
jgi:uncharacterized protein YndB with AHSA1/START domain